MKFSVHYLWLWLGPAVMTMQSITYFQRYTCIDAIHRLNIATVGVNGLQCLLTLHELAYIFKRILVESFGSC